MRGTLPGLDLAADFEAKLDAQGLDTKKTYTYGAEAYDAVVVISLAAALAKTDGINMAKQINGVTRNGTKCTSFKACSDADQGRQDGHRLRRHLRPAGVLRQR